MIYIQHTSFRLYHCHFPQSYLSSLYHTGQPSPSAHDEGVDLCHTREYDFADPQQRAEWFDIFVALVQYLLSGRSKVGYLNNQGAMAGKNNPIHRVVSGKRPREEDDSVEMDSGPD